MKTILFLLIISLNACAAQNMNDIIKLTQEGNIKKVEKMLIAGVKANSVDQHNNSLLLIACMNNNFEMAEMLLKYGADVNQQADNLDSPFLLAGANGQTEFLKLFLNHGARFDIFNRYYGSALIPACERGHVETVRLLANVKDYPVNHVNKLGWTAVMEAVILGDGSEKYQEIIQILKDAGADLSIPDKNGITPLQHARNKGFTKLAQLLQP